MFYNLNIKLCNIKYILNGWEEVQKMLVIMISGLYSDD